MSHQSSPEKPSTFTSAVPVLPTTTIEQAITFYGQLGFQTLHQDAEYAIFQRDTVELHVWLCTDQSLSENWKRQNSEEDLALRPSVGYACGKQPSDEE